MSDTYFIGGSVDSPDRGPFVIIESNEVDGNIADVYGETIEESMKMAESITALLNAAPVVGASPYQTGAVVETLNWVLMKIRDDKPVQAGSLAKWYAVVITDLEKVLAIYESRIMPILEEKNDEDR